MKYEIIVKKYHKTSTEIKKHLLRLENAFKRLAENSSFPLTSDQVERLLADETTVAILDQIVYRFSKLQDSLGKILRLFLSLRGENVENLTMIDVINLAQKRGIDINADSWFELRELRNILTHEYEDECEEIANVLNTIYQKIGYFHHLFSQLELE